MRRTLYGVLGLVAALCLIWLVSCTTTKTEVTQPAAEETKVAQVEKVSEEGPAPSVTPKPQDPFAGEVKPLTPIECARCHYPIFKLLKEKGGKHKQVCTNCHQVYHRYNPVKQNWKEIMPKCQRCHGLPHGKDAKECLSCHQEPHSPRNIALASVSGKCGTCHSSESKELAEHVSAHQEVGCEGCHSQRHGRVPECFECHDPHVEGQTFEECLQCHGPHSPLNIKPFADLKVKNKVCGSCHETEFERLSTTPTKHGKQACTFCHPKHGFLPKCQGCHGLPHSERLHKRFPQCLKCHLDPHSLRKPKTAALKK